MRDQTTAMLAVTFSLLFCSACLGQTKPIDSDARRQIDGGNQEWIDGMKQGDIALVTDAYTADAVDCGPAGNCVRGRSAIEERAKAEMGKLGKADSASVTSIGSVQQGRFVYEWGQAEAHFPGGKNIVDQYLTVWQEQSDGTWKIIRNLVIPNK